MNYKETFAKRLISLREKKNITQQELADELGITRQSLSLYEKSERTINIELLAKIADFFNVSTDYLMGRTNTARLDESIQTACKVTGLSECAVITLSYIDDEITQILNHLLVEMEYGAGDIPKGMLYDLYLYFTIPQIDENDFLKITLNGEIHTGNDNKKSVKTHWKSLFTVHEVNKRDIIDKVLFDSLCDAIRISRYNFLSDINQGDNENG